MSSTQRQRSRSAWWLIVCVACVRFATAAEPVFPTPAALAPDVHFWVRVYTEIDTNSGFLHDENRLGVVYETLHFAANASPREREHAVDTARDRYVAALKRIATSNGPLSPEDQRVRDLWGEEGTPIRLLEATDHVRFQLGQADRFRAGLQRAGKWETHIAETLANLGLPAELAVLPHVESSFNPAAYSKVGAAGLWQFMRSTGRRYMRIDATVDDRLDPFRSTQAAAQLLSNNYRLLGTWPLAVTAYNHGAAGMRRAKDALGTEDIAQIVRNYKSPTFGFASRNFYVSFLAALEIDHNPDKYFGSIERSAEAKFQEVTLPGKVSIVQLERALKIDPDTLKALNPALRPICWSGRRPVPSGYHLRLPLDGTRWTTRLVAAHLATGEGGEAAAEAAAPPVRVANNARPANTNPASTNPSAPPGRETLTARSPALASAPTLANAAPPPAAALPAATPPAAPPPAAAQTAVPDTGAVSPAVAQRESDEDAAAVASEAAVPARKSEPFSAAQAEALGPALGPAAEETSESADPIDYSVAKDGSIHVAAAETLGHYADWLAIPAARLRTVNHLSRRQPVLMGQRIVLDLHRVARDEFERKRRDYHRSLEASYFAEHRIAGTEVYIARRGDSLWTVTQRYEHLPVWLLQQYNPDVDFGAMRTGTQIVVPRIEDVSAAGGT
ncbi:MAG TPA: transglycosylase SLT domain-containing protein [Steroidobacteraceae bacterium]|nr:transglycosylase SLT domain-containing protein [Steroidobacteraceae bacterium]